MQDRLQIINAPTNHAWGEHFLAWSTCTRCEIGRTAFKHVFARGTLPCQILFIGEAPGKTEDLLGYPFVGKSGKLLDLWIGYAKVEIYKQMEKEDQIRSLFKPAADAGFSFAICNLVVCRPPNSEGKDRRPTNQEILNCRPRLQDFLQKIAQPKAIVTLGRPAAEDSPEFSVPHLELPHPSWHLRNGRNTLESTIDSAEELAAFIMKEVL